MTIVNQEIVTMPDMLLVGKATEVRGEVKEQVRMIRALWKDLNAQLHFVPNRLELDPWRKYGLSYNPQPGDQFSYMAAVVVSDITGLPDGFEVKNIPAVTYARFCHKGDFRNLKSTLHDIYNKWLPDSAFHLVPGWKCGLSHFERYDQRFDWSSEDSEIDIFLPVRPKD
jgi:AraC family transcriptional regulator